MKLEMVDARITPRHHLQLITSFPKWRTPPAIRPPSEPVYRQRGHRAPCARQKTRRKTL